MTQPTPDDHEVHVVTFDVNVWLDVAELLGPPFTWRSFEAEAAQRALDPLPHRNHKVDSLRALAVCTTGRFAGPDPLEVWTSDHIDELTLAKAIQPAYGSTPEKRGLGWTTAEAQSLIDGLLWNLAYDLSTGGSVGAIERSHSSPPLSHEDGCVYRTACEAGDDPCTRYCVTNDREFREAKLHGGAVVLYPHEWVKLTRQARQSFAMSRMLS